MRRIPLVIILTFAALLAACAPNASATPALIGAYRAGDAPPVATYVPPAPGAELVYNATVDLLVSDVVTAADAATRLATGYGGYLSDSQRWYDNRELHVALTLVVPSDSFNAVHTGLLRLGTLNSDSVSGDLVPAEPYPWGHDSTFYVFLSPAAPAVAYRAPVVVPSTWPSADAWRPDRTFAAAAHVFGLIFTFLVDAAIWLLVVIGPFVLIALGLRRLFRRPQPAAPNSEEKQS